MEGRLHKFIVEVFDDPEDEDGNLYWKETREVWAEDASDAHNIISMYYRYAPKLFFEVRGIAK